MKVASDKFDVICKDSQGNEHNLYSYDYNEFENTINVKTCAYNTELQRGWIGDLCYTMPNNIDVETYDKCDSVITDTYKDVLLASVVPLADSESVTTWKYTFLKK